MQDATYSANGIHRSVVYGASSLQLAFWAALALGTFFTLINAELPIARNAITYAKAALGIIESHFNILEVARDTAWTSGKPILFAVLAAPFVWLFNVNIGVIIASAIGTTFFLAMSVLTLRRWSSRIETTTLAFVFVAFNPLVMYQFWSGYPDSLFAGLVLLAFVLTDIIATEPERDTRWHIAGLGGVILLAMHTKLYGAVLGLACPIYFLMHSRSLITRSSHRHSKLAILAVVFAALIAVLVLAKLDRNPLLAFEEDAGAGSFELGGPRAMAGVVLASSAALAFTLVLMFHVALLALARPEAWRAGWIGPAMFFGIYLAGLLTFEYTFYNMRYFLPVFPLVAFVLALGVRSMTRTVRRVLLSAYGAVALLLVLSFNYIPVEEALRPVFARTTGQWHRVLDNLRLPAQVDVRRQIEQINEKVRPGSMLYWSSNYYGTATHGLAEQLGVRRGLDIRYVQYASEIPRSATPVFLVEFTSETPSSHATQSPAWSDVRSLGNGLFRLDPFWIECESACDLAAANRPIELRLHATQRGVREKGVEFMDDGRVVHTDEEPPFELTVPQPQPGRHEFIARATDSENRSLVSSPIVVHVGNGALERVVRDPAELAVERPDGSVSPGYQSFGPAGSVLGVRFTSLQVPRGSRVATAYLELPSGELGSAPTQLEVQAELVPDAPATNWAKHDISRRPQTHAVVGWTTRHGTARVRSPNLAAVFEEVFGQPGWRAGNSAVLLVTRVERGAGPRARGNLPQLARLYIELERK